MKLFVAKSNGPFSVRFMDTFSEYALTTVLDRVSLNTFVVWSSCCGSADYQPD